MSEGEISSEPVELTAFVSAVAGSEDALRSCLRNVMEQSHKEAGCVQLQVFERNDAPGSFVLWEIFASPAAVSLHEDTDYMREYFASQLVRTREVVWHRSLE